MDTPPPDPANDPLHEFVDAEITVTDCNGPTREAQLAAAVHGFPGVRSVSILAGKIAVTYEPVFVTKGEMIEAIRGAGFHVGLVESSTSSPVSDALEKVAIEGERLDEKTAPQSGESEPSEAE